MENNNSSEELNETIIRLINENNSWRAKFEEIETIMRLRGNLAPELSLKAAVINVLNERDTLFTMVEKNKKEIKKLLKLILYNDLDKLKEEINLMLFDINNHKI